MRTYTCTPRPPEVFGYPTRPAEESTSRTTCAAATACAKSVPGWGSRSMRSSSGLSTADRRTGHGWNTTVPICAAHATCARSTGHSSSAGRPLGKVIRADSTHGGTPRVEIRFWKNVSPSIPSGNRCSVVGRSRNARMMPSPTDT